MNKEEIKRKFGNLEIAKSNGYVPLDFSELIEGMPKPIVYTKCYCCKGDVAVLKPHYAILDNSGNRKVCENCGDIIADKQISERASKFKFNKKQIY